ncbi:unnamed protein product, partial [Prorocentrum cordatum]
GDEIPPQKLAISGGSVGLAFLFIVVCWFTSSSSKPPKELPTGHEEMEVVFKPSNDYTVDGKIKITTEGTGLSFRQTLEWDDLEVLWGHPERICWKDVKRDKDDGCVIAIFNGKDCFKEPDGHFVHPSVNVAKAAQEGQTWATSIYEVKRGDNENKAEKGTSTVRTGYASWDIEGRVVHVHDAWGRTISCGVVQKSKQPSQRSSREASEPGAGLDASASDRLEVV